MQKITFSLLISISTIPKPLWLEFEINRTFRAKTLEWGIFGFPDAEICCSFQSFQNCYMYQLIILDIISIFGHSVLVLLSLFRLSTQKEYLTVSLNSDFNWFLKIEKVFQYSGIFESILPRYAVQTK